jgi:hypothetical protein
MSHGPYQIDPPFFHKPPETITVDLVKGTLSPDMEGDSVERFYMAITEWFHAVLKKEGIPLEVIESATITISPEEWKKCVIVAQGRTFESFSKKQLDTN